MDGAEKVANDGTPATEGGADATSALEEAVTTAVTGRDLVKARVDTGKVVETETWRADPSGFIRETVEGLSMDTFDLVVASERKTRPPPAEGEEKSRSITKIKLSQHDQSFPLKNIVQQTNQTQNFLSKLRN